MEEKEHRLSVSMMKEAAAEDEEEQMQQEKSQQIGSSKNDVLRMSTTSQSFEKIKQFLKKSPPIEKLEFT